MNAPEHDAVGRVTAFLQGSSATFREAADGGWGVLDEDGGGALWRSR